MDSFIEWNIGEQAADVKGTEKNRIRVKITDNPSKGKGVFDAVG